MAVPTSDWLLLMQHEYLRRYIADRGCAIKFVSGSEGVLADIEKRIETACRERLLPVVKLDAATTKLHMMQDVFFAIAKNTEWDRLAQRWVEAVFRQNGYEWPKPGEAVPLRELAETYRIDQILLRQQVLQWFTRHLMNERELVQDFRSAMANLCMRRLEPSDENSVPPVIEWLRGELRTIGAVRQVPINAKITRHNARAMLRSLCHWLRLIGGRGFVATLDLRQVSRTDFGGGLKWTPAAIMDAFEVLRQLIDEAESFEGFFLFAMTDDNFNSEDSKRSLSVYPALKERIYSEVHSRAHENPLAPLLMLAPDEQPELVRLREPVGRTDMPYLLPRVAIEALRAGVPNRAAIKLLGTSETALTDRFARTLHSVRSSDGAPRITEGEIIAGGFGAGKSHLIGYLAEQALGEDFVVSKVAISKETPLFDPERVFAAAIRNALVPRENADVMALALDRLRPGSNSYETLESWASSPEAGLSPLFAALLHLWPKQTLAPEDKLAVVRFLSGAKIGVPRVKQWLKAAGGTGLVKLFDIKAVKASDLAVQRLRFAPALFRAAGFSGWCVLLDEVELIGRYTPLQRGKSYAELVRWLGFSEEIAVPGIVSVCSIVSDFSDIMNSRLDSEKIPRALLDRDLVTIARHAAVGMEAIESKQYHLSRPSAETVRRSLDKVRQLYQQSYGWTPPGNAVETSSTVKATMRHHIKSWITEWDINRLYGVVEDLTIEEVKSQYDENPALEHAPSGDTAEEEVV